MSDTDWPAEQGAVVALLAANRQRRESAAVETRAAKEELRSLLLRGQAAAMDVADMASEAGVSRDTAHRLLKEAGTMSWRQKQAWASDVLARVPRGEFPQNSFRSVLQMNLYRALGSRAGDVPESVAATLDQAAKSVRETIDLTFSPDYDPELRNLPWPGREPFEIVQRGSGPNARFQLRQRGTQLSPWRSTAERVARDLKAAGGDHPAFIDRTGPECATRDGRRVGWELLAQL